MTVPFITRFAPSPTGELHLGHAYAAAVAHHFATQSGGKMILRIDDIDRTRCRDTYRAQIFDDLAWLGLDWHCATDLPGQPDQVPCQSRRLDAYAAALDRLKGLDLVYPCYLSRRELNALLSAPHDGPTAPAPSTGSHAMPDTRHILDPTEIRRRQKAGQAPAWRLRMQAAIARATAHSPNAPLGWFDHIAGRQTATPDIFGDAVIARADISVSYHLSVVVDDALDRVTLVTRGRDLAPATHLHRLLQALLDLPVPDYCHHPLVCDADGRRLAKRDAAHSLSAMRAAGETPAGILKKMPAFPVLQGSG